MSKTLFSGLVSHFGSFGESVAIIDGLICGLEAQIGSRVPSDVEIGMIQAYSKAANAILIAETEAEKAMSEYYNKKPDTTEPIIDLTKPLTEEEVARLERD